MEMEQLRAREMLLCDFEDKDSNFLYSLGQTDRVYFKSQWWTVSSDQRQKWSEEILKAAVAGRTSGGAAAGDSETAAEHLPVAHAAATVAVVSHSDELFGLLLRTSS